MGIDNLTAGKPLRAGPLVIKKFKITGDLATAVREIRKKIGHRASLQDVLIELIDEGTKAYRRWSAANAKPTEDVTE